MSSAGPLSWERDRSYDDRALVTLDAWQVHVHTGYSVKRSSCTIAVDPQRGVVARS